MTPSNVTSTDVSAALERLLDAIRERHPDLPYCLLSVGSGTSGRTSSLARLDRGAWREQPTLFPELFVSWEALALGSSTVLTLILHEFTHALADVRGIKDTSKEGSYHNRRFLELGSELGLEWASDAAPDAYAGYASMGVSSAALESYRQKLDVLSAVTLNLPVAIRSTPAPSQRNNVKLECSCDPPRIIRASRLVSQGPPIMCGACGGTFRLLL